MTVLSVHPFPSCHTSKYAWGCKGKGLKLETEGWNRVPAVAENTDSRSKISKRKGPRALGTNREVMLIYPVSLTTRAFPVGPHLWP
jgi:hypothetical protein